MKAVINKIEYRKEVETKFGKMYQFRVDYDGKIGTFLSKTNPQTTFKEGVENEFIEEEREYNGTTYYNIKAVRKPKNSPYAKKLHVEQAKYSGFAMAYAKDLRVAGKLVGENAMYEEAKKMFDWMVEQDKTLSNG